MLDYIAFLSCLEFALLNSVYQYIILKPKQVLCLESVYLQNNVMCVLPTGYGKSLIFHLLPMLLFAKLKLRGNVLRGWRSKGVSTRLVDSIVIVVSPLNSLMSNQISRLGASGIKASVINIKFRKRDLIQTMLVILMIKLLMSISVNARRTNYVRASTTLFLRTQRL